MPKPTTKKQYRGSKRADVIRAAVNEFQKHGFPETSMDRVAEAANVSKRTVYNHFPSKEALFQAIMEELLGRCGHLELPTPSDDPLDHQLLVVGRLYVGMITSDDFIKLSRVVLSRFIQSPHLVGTAITGKEPQKPIQDWIEAAQQRGLLPPFDAEQATTEFAGMISATEFWPKLIQDENVPNKRTRDKYLNSIIAMFLGRYAP